MCNIVFCSECEMIHTQPYRYSKIFLCSIETYLIKKLLIACISQRISRGKPVRKITVEDNQNMLTKINRTGEITGETFSFG